MKNKNSLHEEVIRHIAWHWMALCKYFSGEHTVIRKIIMHPQRTLLFPSPPRTHVYDTKNRWHVQKRSNHHSLLWAVFQLRRSSKRSRSAPGPPRRCSILSHLVSHPTNALEIDSQWRLVWTCWKCQVPERRLYVFGFRCALILPPIARKSSPRGLGQKVCLFCYCSTW